MPDQPNGCGPSAFHPDGGGGVPPSGDSSSTGDTVGVSSSGGTANGVAENGLHRSLLGLTVKLDKYDGTTCLETFLASVQNFATYYRWSEEDELFCLRANLTGAAGQVLWDLGTQVSLEGLERLLRKRFGSTDQAERFRTELRTRKRQPNETLQSLYNDICRLMSLAYPGPSSELVDVVGRDAFLEALGYSNLRVVCILDKFPLTMEEALRIALNLEALDRSREAEMRAMVGHSEPSEEEHRRPRDKFIRVETEPERLPASEAELDRPESPLDEVAQLRE